MRVATSGLRKIDINSVNSGKILGVVIGEVGLGDFEQSIVEKVFPDLGERVSPGGFRVGNVQSVLGVLDKIPVPHKNREMVGGEMTLQRLELRFRGPNSGARGDVNAKDVETGSPFIDEEFGDLTRGHDLRGAAMVG